MYDALAIGEILIDFEICGTNDEGYPVLSAFPGGAPANYLAALAKLGMETSIIAKVGTDAFGKLLVRSLEKRGIDTGNIVQDDGFFTTLAFVTLNGNGDREFSFARKPGADTCLDTSEIDWRILEQTRSIYFGATSLTTEPMRTTVRQAVEHAGEMKKMIVFDPNLRIPLWEDLDRAKTEILWGLSYADVVKISREEVEFLFGDNLEKAAAMLHERFDVSLVFITLGEQGCYFSNENARGYVDGIKGIKVTDTTGAGDIFTGSAIYKLLKNGKKLCELCRADIFDIAHFACTCAGLSTARPGGMTSVCNEEEILMFMKEEIR